MKNVWSEGNSCCYLLFVCLFSAEMYQGGGGVCRVFYSGTSNISKFLYKEALLMPHKGATFWFSPGRQIILATCPDLLESFEEEKNECIKRKYEVSNRWWWWCYCRCPEGMNNIKYNCASFFNLPSIYSPRTLNFPF